MNDKLTPRVGDRVLVKTSEYGTRTGDVLETTRTDDIVKVNVHGLLGPPQFYDVSLVTVVDRDPVEWPEGWERNGVEFAYNHIADIVFDKNGLKHILATGPDMLSRWDELIGDDA